MLNKCLCFEGWYDEQRCLSTYVVESNIRTGVSHYILSDKNSSANLVYYPFYANLGSFHSKQLNMIGENP